MTSSRLRSLQWSLPIAVAALLLVCLLAIALFSYRSVAQTEREAAFERLQALSTQYAGLLQTEARNTAQLVATIAGRPAVRGALGLLAPATRAAAESTLTAGRPAKVLAVEVRDPTGRRLLAAGPDTGLVQGLGLRQLIAGGRFSDSARVGPFYARDSTVLIPAVAPIRDRGAAAGYVVQWWRIGSGDPAASERLLGPGSAMLLGTADGPWTDQADTVARPPAPLELGGKPLRYLRGSLGPRLAIATAVPSSPWLLVLEFSEERVLSPATTFLRRMAAASALVFALGLLGTWLLMRRVTGPLMQLAGAAETIAAGDYAHRVRLDRPDELGRVGAAFDTMADRIQATHERLEANIAELRSTQAQFAHMQRMEAVGRLAGGVAHDFNNLLSIILAECELALGSLPRGHEVRASLEDIEQVAVRAAALTRQLLAFSRRQRIEPTTFSLNEMVTDLERVLQRLLGETIRLVATPGAAAPMVRADRAQVEQVLLNLVVNARDAMPQGGRLGIDTRNVTLDENYAAQRAEVTPGDYVMFAVSDTGVGMTPEEQAHLFEPFYTTKEPGKGTGLGLATCYGIVKQSRGHIAAYSELGKGSTFRVYLPAVAQQPELAAGEGPASFHGTERVLLVEDELALRHVAGRILTRQGYTVHDAASAEDALVLLGELEGRVDLMITDVVLPQIGGRELAERVTREWPGIKVLFVTGYTDDVVFQHQLVARNMALLQKPYTMTSLGRKVRAVLDGG